MPFGRKLVRRLRRSLTVGIALLFAGALPAGAKAAAISIESNRRGDVVEIRASAELAADQGTAWRVLTDYARYAEFVPGLRESRVVARNGSTVMVEQSGRALVGPLRLPVSITYRIQEYPPLELESQAVAGSLSLLESHYTLTARPRGSRLVFSGVVRSPLLLLPEGRETVETNARRQFHALVDEIERQHVEQSGESSESPR